MIWGYPYLWKHPYVCVCGRKISRSFLSPLSLVLPHRSLIPLSLGSCIAKPGLTSFDEFFTSTSSRPFVTTGLSDGVFFNGTLHPRKLTWNLKMNPWKRRFPLKTIITLWMFPEKVFKLQLPSGKLTWLAGISPSLIGNTSSIRVYSLLLR